MRLVVRTNAVLVVRSVAWTAAFVAPIVVHSFVFPVFSINKEQILTRGVVVIILVVAIPCSFHKGPGMMMMRNLNSKIESRS